MDHEARLEQQQVAEEDTCWQYLQEHPEVEQIVNDFVTSCITFKPADLNTFAKNYFLQFQARTVDHAAGATATTATSAADAMRRRLAAAAAAMRSGTRGAATTTTTTSARARTRAATTGFAVATVSLAALLSFAATTRTSTTTSCEARGESRSDDDDKTARSPPPPPIATSVLDCVGNTPLLELRSLSQRVGRRILAKVEYAGLGANIKDRASKYMLLELHEQVQRQQQQQQQQQQQHEQGSRDAPLVIESTGGNTGIGLALFGNALGYPTLMVMPQNVSPDKIELTRTLGSDVRVQPTVPFSDPQHFYHTGLRLAKELPNAYCTQQFESLANFRAHYEGTGPEIWAQTNGAVDAFVCSAGTGGTIGGITRALKERNPRVRCFLVDPENSGLLSYMKSGQFVARSSSSLMEGIGIFRLTANFRQALPLLDGAVAGIDREAVDMAYYLLQREGVFVGPSAALNVCGAIKVARMLPPGSTVVTVLCDTGERYRHKLYSREWLAERDLLPRMTPQLAHARDSVPVDASSASVDGVWWVS